MKHFLHNILTVKDMKDFSEINLGYSTFFNFNPPSRFFYFSNIHFLEFALKMMTYLEMYKWSAFYL